ncbi:hypothetical protein ABZT17_28015 [Streptomyces sp. NPDC005648]|uniref:hypothetical protein n=1 Tax=Streptomyces sp. NPDC005648 TaxID=3157044 RepID=UPI0033B8A050
MDDKLFAAVVSAVAALFTGVLSYVAARLRIQADVSSQTDRFRHDIDQQSRQFDSALELQQDRLRTELRTQFMAEEAIRELLRSAQPKRSFDVIERRVGGFDGNALRQLLVRAGAVRFYGSNDRELWGLRERNGADLEGDR